MSEEQGRSRRWARPLLIAAFVLVLWSLCLAVWSRISRSDGDDSTQVEEPEMYPPYAQLCFLIPGGVELPASYNAKVVGGDMPAAPTELPLSAQEAKDWYCSEIWMPPRAKSMEVTLFRDVHGLLGNPDFEELWLRIPGASWAKKMICDKDECRILLRDMSEIPNHADLEPQPKSDTPLWEGLFDWHLRNRPPGHSSWN